jgi:hypothetical protein
LVCCVYHAPDDRIPDIEMDEASRLDLHWIGMVYVSGGPLAAVIAALLFNSQPTLGCLQRVAPALTAEAEVCVGAISCVAED